MSTNIVLGTATPGGGFPLYGGAFADTVNETDPSLHVEPRNTKGSTENIPLWKRASSTSRCAPASRPMRPSRASGGRASDLKIIAAMYSTAGMFIVRGDSPARTIDDLKGKPVAFGAKGSGLTILSRYVLEGLGLDQVKDFQPIFLDKAGDGPAMVLDGRAAALWGGGVGWPGFAAVAQAGGRFIAPTAEEATRIRAKHSFLKSHHPARRQLCRAERRDPIGRVVELRAGAADARRRHRLCTGPRARQRPCGVCQAARRRRPRPRRRTPRPRRRARI